MLVICHLFIFHFTLGLSEAEVELAIAKAKETNPNLGLEMAQAFAPLSGTPPPVAQRLVERKRSWKEYAFITVIVAGVSYVIVMVVKVSVVWYIAYVCACVNCL